VISDLKSVYSNSSFEGTRVRGQALSATDYYPFGLDMPSRDYKNTAFEESSYRFGFNGEEVDRNNEWGNSAHYNYGARVYNPNNGIFLSIDRFAEKYPSLTPYQYGANNPILNIDINGDSIRTFFYDQEGIQQNTIPSQVHNMFANEYGISVGYDSETNMLYQTGYLETENEISEPGRKEVEGLLGITNAETELIFGYDLGENDGKEITSINFGRHSGGREKPGETYPGVALIDLADFNSNGSLKYHKPNSKFNPRSDNLARTFEHEFFGHGIQGHWGDPYGEKNAVKYVNRVFREPAKIPTRQGYTDKYSNLGNAGFNTKRKYLKKLQKIRKIIDTSKHQKG